MRQQAPSHSAQPQPAPPGGSRRPVTPFVRRLAAERGVDLEELRATGEGRVRPAEVTARPPDVVAPVSGARATTGASSVQATGSFAVDAAVPVTRILMTAVEALHADVPGAIGARLETVSSASGVDDATSLGHDGLLARLLPVHEGPAGTHVRLLDLLDTGLLTWQAEPNPGSILLTAGDVQTLGVGVDVDGGAGLAFQTRRTVTIAVGAGVGVDALALAARVVTPLTLHASTRGK